MKLKENILDSIGNIDLWDYLKNVKKPILIYGMGNGADKIIDTLSSYGIEYCDVFASDDFVRGHSYRGRRVLSYSEAKKIYGDFVILLSFGSKLDNVLSHIYELDKENELYAPDVPIAGKDLFNLSFFSKNYPLFEEARNLLSDERSIQVYDNVIKYKLSGKISFLREIEDSEDDVGNILNYDSFESYLDLGAYNGDTIKKYLKLCPKLKKIYAFEPDIKNFKKLSSLELNYPDLDLNLYNMASYSSDTTLYFSQSGNRNSSISATPSYESKTLNIQAVRPDEYIDKVDFIKFDVEGNEFESLKGCQKIIDNSNPQMLISVYHRSDDLFKIPIELNKMNSSYKMYLRKHKYIPSWDLNLYVKTGLPR